MSHPYQARPVAATHVRLTPPAIKLPLGEFDLDPCAAPNWPTATEMWMPPRDGLAHPWTGRVWLNPPYGRETGKWLAKLAAHGNGIALVFARTETRMFADYVWSRAQGLLFLQGRPHFHLPDGTRAKGNSGGPLVLIAYGWRNVAALRDSALPGKVVEL